MWSLPDIKSLNARAAANVAALKREAKRKRKPNCEVYGCDCRAVESVEWFDIFSDDPKGLIHVCGEHPADAVEGFFTCEDCQRIVVDHYTWERYQTEVDGASVCLKCAAERHFADDDNWIDPRRVKSVVLESNNHTLFDYHNGVLNAARCRHVLGVSQPPPAGVRFLDNAEFDSLDGHQISGRRLLEIIQELDEPFCPVLDAAYQFAVSIGIYVRRAADEQKEAA
jgi:hypothetical protein